MYNQSFEFYQDTAKFLERMIEQYPNNEHLISVYCKLIERFTYLEECSIKMDIQMDNNDLDYKKATLPQD